VNSIEVSGLTKSYGRVEALGGADLSVGRGEIFGNGFRRTEIIAGYVLGFLGLATFQAVAGLAEASWLFELDYDEETPGILFVVALLLLSSLTRREVE
jgi:hypothetical protein